MEALIKKDGKSLCVTVSGKLDSLTSTELEKKLKENFDGISELVFDFSGLEYISSAGLRVLLGSHKTMAAKGGVMTVKNANESIVDIFTITGMITIFNME